LPDNQPDVDRLFPGFSAYPAVHELHTEHEHGMPSELQAFQYTEDEHGISLVDAEEDTSETVVELEVDVGVEALPEDVPAMVDDVASVASSAFVSPPPGPAAIALENARNQLFADLTNRGKPFLTRRIQPSVEWKDLPRRKVIKVQPFRPTPSKHTTNILPEEIDRYVLTAPRPRWDKEEWYRAVLKNNYMFAVWVAKRAEERRKAAEAAARRAEEAQRVEDARRTAEARRAEEARQQQQAAANGAKRAARRAEQQRKLDEVRAKRKLAVAKLHGKAI
jgi:hypothetical protein